MLKFAVAALLSLVVAGVVAAQPLVVHHIGPFTGVLAASNQEAIDGARLYLEAFNARGGVRGRPVQLQTHDDAQDAGKSKLLLDKLIADGPPLAVLMPRTTPTMDALLPAALLHGIPIVGPQTGASFVNQPPRRTVFTLRASYQREAEVAIRQQHSIGARRFALLLADDAFGKDTLLGIERVLAELKLKPVATARIDNRQPDTSAAVRDLATQRPEVVLMIVSSRAAASFVKGYRQQAGGATFISLSNTSNNDYVKSLGDQVGGAIVMQVMPSPYSGVTALAREYAAVAAAVKQPLSYAGFYGFATAKLLCLGLDKAGRNATPAGLVTALEGLGDIDLGGFRLRYGPDQRVGSSFVDSTIITAAGQFRR